MCPQSGFQPFWDGVRWKIYKDGGKHERASYTMSLYTWRPDKTHVKYRKGRWGSFFKVGVGQPRSLELRENKTCWTEI